MLDELRKTIDAVDAEILSLLNRRAAIAKKIGRVKLRAGLPMVDANREVEVLRKIVRENEGTLDDAAAARIYTAIIGESRRIQTELAEAIANSRQLGK